MFLRLKSSLQSMKSLIPGLVLWAGDQLLKSWCSTHIQLLKRVPIFGQTTLALSHVLNRGLMWDEFSGVPSGYIETYTRYYPTAVFAALLTVGAWRWREAGRLERAAIGLFACGGASNLIDHWRSEFVIDTFQVYMTAQEHMPFNIADLGIVFGSIVLGLSLVRELVRSFKSAPSQASRVAVLAVALLTGASTLSRNAQAGPLLPERWNSSLDFSQVGLAFEAATAKVGEAQSPYLAWLPEWRLSEENRIGVQLGAASFQDSLGGRFFAVDLLAQGRRWWDRHWRSDLGLGGQLWISNGGFQPQIAAAGSYFPTAKWPLGVERVYTSASFVAVSSNPVWIFGLGVGFRL